MKHYIVLFFSFFSVASCVATEKYNVTVTMHVTPYINKTEQMAYIYHHEGDDYFIDDSVRIVPSVNDYLLKSRIPYETNIIIMFTKCGPLKLEILAHAGDSIDLDITEDDDHLYPIQKMLNSRSKHHEAFVAFNNEQKRVFYGQGLLEGNDSIGTFEEQKIKLYRHWMESSPYPYIAKLANFLLWGQISKEEFTAMENSLRKKFPDYPPITRLTVPKATKEGRKTHMFIIQIGREREKAIIESRKQK